MSYDWKTIPKQQILRDPEQPKIAGDCWRCCIAAILQIPALEVPHFLQVSMDEGSGCMDTLTQEWLNTRGFYLIEADAFRFYHFGGKFEYPPVISGGPSPRSKRMGQHHAVVMVGNDVVYDPHPDESGLTAITKQWMIAAIPSN